MSPYGGEYMVISARDRTALAEVFARGFDTVADAVTWALENRAPGASPAHTYCHVDRDGKRRWLTGAENLIVNQTIVEFDRGTAA